MVSAQTSASLRGWGHIQSTYAVHQVISLKLTNLNKINHSLFG